MQPFVPMPRTHLVARAAIFVGVLCVLVSWVPTSGFLLSDFVRQNSVSLIFACGILSLVVWQSLRHAYRIEVADNSISFVTLTGTIVVPMGSVSALRRAYFSPFYEGRLFIAVLVHASGTVKFTFPFKGHHVFLRALKQQNPGASVSIS